jgi:hypothetical protein
MEARDTELPTGGIAAKTRGTPRPHRFRLLPSPPERKTVATSNL